MLGWLDVLHDAGITPSVVNVASRGAAVDAARPLLSSDQRPTGVLCFSDALALGVLDAAHELGLAVPADLSVVGFDDSVLARRSEIPITTIHQDVADKGRLAAKALTAAIDRDRAGSRGRARHEVLPTELVIRDSTAAPPRRVGTRRLVRVAQ
jgi:DNA-binding LacI/PurR family transcriptional regulator